MIRETLKNKKKEKRHPLGKLGHFIRDVLPILPFIPECFSLSKLSERELPLCLLTLCRNGIIKYSDGPQETRQYWVNLEASGRYKVKVWHIQGHKMHIWTKWDAKKEQYIHQSMSPYSGWCSVPRKMCSYISRCLNVLYLKCLRNVLQILGAQSSQGTASRSCKVYFTKFFLFPRYSFIGCRSLSKSPVHFRKSRRDHEFFMSSMDFRKYLEFGFNHDCIFHHRICN